jgi:NADP-dependent 3-hydroxy acid dehydrogenase YdfG
MDLRGKAVVVTGASSGIGAATAVELAEAGANVVLNARREDRLTAVADGLATEAAVLAADISDHATPERLLGLALATFGRADGIINNAGTLLTPTIEDVDLDALTRLIGVNFEAVVRSSYVFAEHFKAQRSGAIINVSSIGAHVNPSKWGVYSGLKSGLETFTNTLRVELAGSGVKVGSIAPGTVATDIFDGIRPDDEWKESALLPEDVAGAIRFMLEQSERVNIASLLIYSSRERA